MNRFYQGDWIDSMASRFVDELPEKHLEKNSFFDEEINNDDDFDFNQDFEIEEGTSEGFKDYDSELLLKILNKTSLENKKSDDKELFLDENWKINSKNMSNIIPSNNSNLKRILSDIFPNKKIMIQDNNDGSQTIFLS